MAISTTYTPIENYTLGSAASSITFGSGGTIPQTYTDLILIINGYQTVDDDVYLQFNGDTSTNYSVTGFYGNGSSPSSFRGSNLSAMTLGGLYTSSNGNAIYHIQNYSSANTYKTVLARANAAASGTQGRAGFWRKAPEAITSIKVGSNSGNFASGTTFALYGIAAAPAAGSNKATGGTITAASGYTYHAFTSGGTFTPSEDITADILVIAGGGGGGTYSGGGGGGGAGGVLLLANQSLTSGTGYTVSVGGGGAANTNGQNSYFGALTQAVGGGKGGSGSVGGNGGSGGGGGDSFAGGTGTAGQGFAGGLGTGAGASPGGGGGGALEKGEDAYGDTTPNIAGKGGSGTNFYYDWAGATSTGVNGYFAGGGGGGVYIQSSFSNNGGGAGGNGGGGSGTASSKNATNNTGSGGGGGAYTTSPVAPGNGGSGIVIVRYAN